jgi:TatA/E family protein of Tat protein translocase
MGSVGFQEMGFIFLLALLLFGPKKLPELGRMFGKALTEFRRAQSELKATFEREMKNLDRENESLKEITSGYQFDNSNSNYDYSSYDSGMYGDQYHQSTTGSHDSTVTTTPTISASATEGAEYQSAATPEGAIAHGAETAAASNGSAPYEGARPDPAANSISAIEHSA